MQHIGAIAPPAQLAPSKRPQLSAQSEQQSGPTPVDRCLLGLAEARSAPIPSGRVLVLYGEYLERFPIDVIREACFRIGGEEVAEFKPRWPEAGVIVAECRRIQQQRRPPAVHDPMRLIAQLHPSVRARYEEALEHDRLPIEKARRA